MVWGNARFTRADLAGKAYSCNNLQFYQAAKLIEMQLAVLGMLEAHFDYQTDSGSRVELSAWSALRFPHWPYAVFWHLDVSSGTPQIIVVQWHPFSPVLFDVFLTKNWQRVDPEKISQFFDQGHCTLAAGCRQGFQRTAWTACDKNLSESYCTLLLRKVKGPNSGNSNSSRSQLFSGTDSFSPCFCWLPH